MSVLLKERHSEMICAASAAVAHLMQGHVSRSNSASQAVSISVFDADTPPPAGGATPASPNTDNCGGTVASAMALEEVNAG